MDNSLMFSSANQAWSTRPECFNQIQDLVGYEFTLDPCAEKETAKCARFFTKEDDMFAQEDWGYSLNKFDGEYCQSKVFCNPVYGREQPKFVKEVISRIELEQVSCATVLIPARTDTKLFHQIILPKASCVTFYEGRLVFGTDAYWESLWEQEFLVDPKGKKTKNSLFGKVGKFTSAPFPSMIVEFTEDSVLGEGNDLLYPNISTLKAPKFTYKG